MEYLTESEMAKMPQKEQKQYLKDYESLRRVMRALIANQNSREPQKGKNTINTVAKRYGYREDENIVNALIMEAFINNDHTYEYIRELYENKREFDLKPIEYRKKLGLKDPKSPIDYFSLPTMYHFYNFRKAIIENHKIRDTNGNRVFGDLKELINFTREQYFSKSNEKNLFAQDEDVFFHTKPIRSYTSINQLQKKQDENLNPIEKSQTEPVVWKMKKQVLDFMISYVTKSHNLKATQVVLLENYYTNSFATYIKGKKFVKPIENKLLQTYVFNNFSQSKNKNKTTKEKADNVRSKNRTNAKNTMEQEIVNDNFADKNFQNTINVQTIKEERERERFFTNDEYCLTKRDGNYYFENGEEYRGHVFDKDGVVVDQYDILDEGENMKSLTTKNNNDDYIDGQMSFDD